jgi:AAA domain, putative AbiEii toxin, Type IV TA system
VPRKQALAERNLSESYARKICEWSDKLPGDCPDAADAILLAAAKAGAHLDDLVQLAAEMYTRSLPGPGIGDDRVLVLDEPLTGLDPDSITWIRGLLRSLAAGDRTVLITSHQLSELAQTADDVVILSRGRLVAQATMSELFLDLVRNDQEMAA